MSNKSNNINLKESEIELISDLTKGYSGADMKSLCKEAAMIPIREQTDLGLIKNLKKENIRSL